MTTKEVRKMVYENDLVAEVVVEHIYNQDAWSPYLSVKDAKKLDAVREALRQSDLKTASRYGQVYRLTPIPA